MLLVSECWLVYVGNAPPGKYITADSMIHMGLLVGESIEEREPISSCKCHDRVGQ